MKPRLVVYECPAHQSIRTLVVEKSEAGGTRVTGGKCCPQQYGIKLVSWILTDNLIDNLLSELKTEPKEPA